MIALGPSFFPKHQLFLLVPYACVDIYENEPL